MDLITIDYETYYDREYSLSKITTEEYIRDPRFEVIGVAVKVNDGETEWFSGTMEETKTFLSRFDWANSIMLAQNTMFDGAIQEWRFGIRPRAYFDTMCMARTLHGTEVSVSLANLAKRYGVGDKGNEVIQALGLRRKDFGSTQLKAYSKYCIQDVELTYAIAKDMITAIPKIELRVIDLTLRMFIQPTLELDLLALESHLIDTKHSKEKLLEDSGYTKKELMSNPKFADALLGLGVTPPLKISPTTGKEAYAFAKSDKAFLALMEHENPNVQALVSARLGNKSTLEESRTERFISIAKRGKLPAPIKYYAAHTSRWGGMDKINLQNLPSRGPNAYKLKKTITAPEGYLLVACDASQIEARILAWLAGQEDLVDSFARDEDVYKEMATRIYNKDIADIEKGERFVGKTTILGCGYQMGADRFREQSQVLGIDLTPSEAKRIVSIYRSTNPKIKQLWADAQLMLRNMANGRSVPFGRAGVISVDGIERTLTLPTGIKIRYDDLSAQETEKGLQFTYNTRRGRNKIYGGKVIENVCQAIARCIMAEQMVMIDKRYRVAFTVHDEVTVVVPENEIDDAVNFIGECMLHVPKWAEGVPLACEAGYASTYGDCSNVEIKFTRANK